MNLFDILGPVMVGPSSSHTAGAVRIGYISGKLLQDHVVKAEILLHGSFATTGIGHGTDKALIAGLLGMRPDDIRIPDSFFLAKKDGMEFSFSTITLKDAHPNTAVLRLTGEHGRKIAVVTDSNSGITQAQAKEMGVAVLPMPFMIDGETYYEDITLTREQFYQRLKDNADIATSQPTPDSILKMWDKLLKEYDQIIHIPMSSGLSGSCSTAMMLAGEDEYEGKVFVVDNRRISVTQYQSVKDAQMLAAMGMDGTQIKKRLEETAADSVIFITVDTLKYLKKGGRITPAAAALGTLLKIKPVLIILGEKLDSFAKARTMKQAKTMMMNAIQKELDGRLHDSECRNCHLAIAHTDNEEAALEFKKEVEERFPNADVYMAPLSLSIACHIGPGSLAVTATRKMEEEHEKN